MPDGSSDRLHVDGTARLAGTVRAVPSGDAFAAGTRYTILTATGGLGGTTLDAVTASSLAFQPALSYDATKAYLTLVFMGFAQIVHDLIGIASALDALPGRTQAVLRSTSLFAAPSDRKALLELMMDCLTRSFGAARCSILLPDETCRFQPVVIR